MKPFTVSRPTPIEWGTLIFATWQSRDLLSAWQDSPKDRGGYLILFVWLLPFLAACLRGHPRPEAVPAFRQLLTLGAIGLVLVGSLGSLNAMTYCGLATIAAAGIASRYPAAGLAWLATSLAWMPALSYALKAFPTPALFMVKLLAAATGTAIILNAMRNRKSLS